METQEVVDIQIDNEPSQLRQYLTATLVPVDFKDGLKVRDFWRQSDKGTYFLITKSELEPYGVHVSLLKDGQLEYANRCLLKPLIGVHEVFEYKN
jgi:hypothetical protein